MFHKRLYTSMLLVIGMACASAPASEPVATTGMARTGDIITAEELADPSFAGVDLLDAVIRLRPRFLQGRGRVTYRNNAMGTTHVSVDGGPLVSVEQLTRLRPNQVAEVRFYGAADAAQRFGASAGSGGVILITSK